MGRGGGDDGGDDGDGVNGDDDIEYTSAMSARASGDIEMKEEPQKGKLKLQRTENTNIGRTLRESMIYVNLFVQTRYHVPLYM